MIVNDRGGGRPEVDVLHSNITVLPVGTVYTARRDCVYVQHKLRSQLHLRCRDLCTGDRAERALYVPTSNGPYLSLVNRFHSNSDTKAAVAEPEAPESSGWVTLSPAC